MLTAMIIYLMTNDLAGWHGKRGGRGRWHAEPRRQRRVAIFEELAISEDPLGARGQRGAALRVVVMLAHAQDAEPGRGRKAHGSKPVVRAGRHRKRYARRDAVGSTAERAIGHQRCHET